MTLSDIRLLVGNYIDTLWEDRTPIKRPNHKFTPPEMSSWIEYRILPGQAFEGELNGGVGVRTGVIQVIVSVPVDTGTKAAVDDCALLEAGLRHQVLVTNEGKRLITGESYSKELGPDGVWFKYVVTVSFDAFVGD